jgi:hypothetical protein
MANQNEEISGMYFGLLDIVAYQHSPGFSDHGKADWAYYYILDDSYAEARDIVLLSGGEVDLAALNPYPYSLDERFKSVYDNFSIDFLEVNISNPGVFFGNNFYGFLSYSAGQSQQDAFNALCKKYPAISNFSLYDFGFPFYSNMEGFPKIDVTFSVVFARADWFPEPVFVYLESVDGNSYTTKTYSYNWSSKPLTDHQKELLEGMAGNPGASWFRRSHIIIPYSYMYSFGVNGPVKLAIKEGAEGMGNPEFRISFDFKQLLTDETYNNIKSEGSWNQSPDGPNPAFTYRSTGNIPFGLIVTVNDVK